MRLTLLSMNTADFTFYQGIVIAATGILTVLLILSIISVCIWITSKIIYFAEHKDEKVILRKKTKPEAIPVSAPEPEPVVVQEEPKTDDKAIVAAITAAIAASLNTSTDRLVVRSFRRSNNWQAEALNEQRQHPTAL